MGIQAGTTLTVEFSHTTYGILMQIFKECKYNLFSKDAERSAQVKNDIQIINRDVNSSLLTNNVEDYLTLFSNYEVEFSAIAIAKLDCLLQSYEMYYPSEITSESQRLFLVNEVYAVLHKAGYR